MRNQAASGAEPAAADQPADGNRLGRDPRPDVAELVGKLTSRVFTDNAASRAAHLRAGSAEVGIQRRHGRLDGEWKDCVLVERLLGPAADQDSQPVSSSRAPGRT
jgi:hypothetical protein